jgi:hypothetical protein
VPSRLSLKAGVLAVMLATGSIGVGWVALTWELAGWMRWLLVGVAVTGVSVLVLWGLLGPGARWLVGERDRLTAQEHDQLSVAQRVEAVNQARQALMQAVTGMVVIGGVVFTAAGLVYTAKTLDTTQQGQVTDRYTSAIEQLGAGEPEVRLGGIYALERLMLDSPRDRRTILEVMAAYVRTHAQDDPPAGSPSLRLAVDVQASLNVIGRNRSPTSNDPVDLTSIDLHEKNINRMNLFGVNLHDANLAGAKLLGTNLTGARLTEVNLTGADLTEANLTGADLSGADLRNIQGLTAQQIRQQARTDAHTRF